MHDPAGVEHDDGVRDAADDAEILLHEQDRRVLARGLERAATR